MLSSAAQMRFLVVTDPGTHVQVLYALPEEQVIVELELAPGMTAAAAVVSSGLVERYPEIGREALVLGIWGVEVSPDRVLRAGDRVEISRALVADPRDMRRALLSGGRVMGGANAPPPAVSKKVRG
jgi:putative ubiquitin-RnfH superfamily antitoxin RatB of RatAB toxin-antitoxin module